MFSDLQKLIIETARNLNQEAGQTLYNIELNDEEDIKILILLTLLSLIIVCGLFAILFIASFNSSLSIISPSQSWF